MAHIYVLYAISAMCFWDGTNCEKRGSTDATSIECYKFIALIICCSMVAVNCSRCMLSLFPLSLSLSASVCAIFVIVMSHFTRFAIFLTGRTSTTATASLFLLWKVYSFVRSLACSLRVFHFTFRKERQVIINLILSQFPGHTVDGWMVRRCQHNKGTEFEHLIPITAINIF